MAEVAVYVRDEVLAMYEVETADGPIRQLYNGLRRQLIADLTPERFADVYAQTMVYGLLTARISHPERFREDASLAALDFENPFLDAIYARFRHQSEDVLDIDELGLAELAEELAATDIDQLLADFGTRNRRAYHPVVHFYEDFLKAYDPAQQIDLGVYYTPQPVVEHIVRTVDQLLKDEYRLPLGVADPTPWSEILARTPEATLPAHAEADKPFVAMLDPATGTGTFLVQWLAQAESNVREQAANDGVRGAAQDDLWHRHLEDVVLPQMAAFEISLASYTVAHLKVSLALPPEIRKRTRLPIYLTDTLAPPVADDQLVFDDDDPIADEARLATEIKTRRAITVIIGNPPYRERAAGHGGIVEQSSRSRQVPSLDAFREPGAGKVEFNLHNLNVYFWRWACWMTLDRNQGSGGIVSFITTSPYLASPAFQGMRRYIRGTADVALVVDCTPEGHQPDVPTRLFPTVQQPLAIMTVADLVGAHGSCDVRYRSIHGGQQQKFRALLDQDRQSFEPVLGTGAEPFMPVGGIWVDLPKLNELMPWATTGMTSNRSWVIAPHPDVLKSRWEALAEAPPHQVNPLLSPTRDRSADRVVGPLPGYAQRGPLIRDRTPMESPAPLAWRAFDRQWVIPDQRVLDMPRPPLWRVLGRDQVFVMEHHSEPLRRGPGLLFTALLPASSYVKGSGGGRVLPLFADADGTQANLHPRLLPAWSTEVGVALTPFDWIRYLAGVTGYATFQQRFAEDLLVPGVRLPISTDLALVQRAQTLGDIALWAHTLGARGTLDRVHDFAPDVELPAVAVRPDDTLPTSMRFNEDTRELTIGTGQFAHVHPAVFSYTTSDMNVLRKWFGYRKAKPRGRSSGALTDIVPTHWYDEWTDELVQILRSLTYLVAAEPVHQALLDRITEGPILASSVLE